MIITLALALASQARPQPPDGDRWAWLKTVHTISDTLTCKPNGTFSVTLQWRLHKGVEHVVIKQNGREPPSAEIDKLASALRRATDLNFVQLSCLGGGDAIVRIAYVGAYRGETATMMLIATIRPTGIEVSPPMERGS